ncbi:hypothetical protein ACA910_010661 [Epithemia clementina (nom. ined.)]
MSSQFSTKPPTRADTTQTKDRRRFKHKRFLPSLSKILPRFGILVLLMCFSWQVYMLHSSAWNGADIFFETTGDEHRFLEHFRSNGLMPRESDRSLTSVKHIRLRRPPQISRNFSVASRGSLVNLQIPESKSSSHSQWASKNWRQVCSEAGLDQSSRVLVTNVISQHVATFAALNFAARCNVRTVVGTDALFPNLRVSRLRHMQTYKKLYQGIPNFRLIVTELGLGRPIDKTSPSWLWEFNPTHVLVSDHITNDQTIDVATTQRNYQLYVEKHNDRVWSDLFSALSLQKQRSTSHGPRIVHLSTSFESDFDRLRKTATAHLPILYSAGFPLNITRLALPHLYGPGSSFLTHFDDPFQHFVESVFALNVPHIHVDEALKAIVGAFCTQTTDGYIDLKVPESLILSSDEVTSFRAGARKLSSRVLRSIEWNHFLQNPFGQTNTQSKGVEMQEPFSPLESVGTISPLPCASKCTTAHMACEPSVFDALIEISVKASSKCQLVVYMGNFSNSLTNLPLIDDRKPDGLCRFAFVSKNSKIVQEHKLQHQKENKEQISLPDLNGNLTEHGWVLLWPSRDFEDFSVSDASLLRIDPSRLFSTKVRKALFLGSSSFAQISNGRALQLLSVVDRKGFEKGERRYHEFRSGTNLKRWVPLPASKPRHSVLFAGSLFPASLGPVSPDILLRGKNHSAQQVEFYKQVAHRVHTNIGRPEFEIRSTVFKTFPFQWIAPYFLVHNLQMEEGRLLRCEWLEEHISWAKPSQVKGSAEELSLGFVLGRRKTMGLIGESDPYGESEGMMPFFAPGSEDVPLLDSSGAEVFIDILEPQA